MVFRSRPCPRSHVAAGTSRSARTVRSTSQAARFCDDAASKDVLERLQRVPDLRQHTRTRTQPSVREPGEGARRSLRTDRDTVSRDLRGEARVQRRPEPRAAVLDLDAGAGELAVPGAPAQSVARLQHHDGAAGLAEIARCDQAGEPTADHHDIQIRHAASQRTHVESGARNSQPRSRPRGPDRAAARVAGRTAAPARSSPEGDRATRPDRSDRRSRTRGAHPPSDGCRTAPAR